MSATVPEPGEDGRALVSPDCTQAARLGGR